MDLMTLEHDTIDDNMQASHICDNKDCVRPEHIVLGSQSFNMQGTPCFHNFAVGMQQLLDAGTSRPWRCL
jgi:hypothetical protein